jgi:ATP-binding cassette subfamily B protein
MKLNHRHFLWRNRRNLYWAILLLIFTDLLVFLFPLFVKWIIDRLQGNPLPKWFPESLLQLDALWFSICFCLLLISLSALSVAARFYWRVFIIWSFFPKMHDLRMSLFDHLASLSSSFFRKNKSGDLLSTLSEDTEKLRLTLSFGSLAVIDTIINFLIFPWMLFWLSPEISIVVIPFLIVTAGALIFLSDRLTAIYERVQDLIAAISAKAFEIVGAARVIKAFAKEPFFKKEFHRSSQNLANTAVRLAYFESTFMPALHLALGLSMAFVLFYGGKLIFEGRWTVADLIAYQLYLGRLDWPVVALGWFIEMYRTSKASLGRMNKVLSAPKVRSSIDSISSTTTNTLIEAKDLGFRFDKRALWSSLNFKIEKGKWYGLTGPLGSGKSTLLKILSGQSDPYRGSVQFLKNEISEIDRDLLERHILFVPQEVFLFSKSIRGNLTFGADSSQINRREIEGLLKNLRFDLEGLESRGGLSTKLGERGINVSGGQKQRLAIARSLLRHRDVYLFDDVFSHVDAETEADLLKFLKTQMNPQAAVVFVSQRLETLTDLDEIFVLEESGFEFQGAVTEAMKTSRFLNQLERLQRKFGGVS